MVKTHSFKKSASLIRSAVKLSVIASAVAMSLTGALAEGTDASHTPSGAEIAGTASGIPAWTPWATSGRAGATASAARISSNTSPTSRCTIDAGNVDKYADKLNPGQIALLKNLKGFTMPVYPSRRTCGVPDFVAENTKNNAGFAKMSADGSELTDAHLPGYPFPAPKTGAEVMWNAKLHYRGAGVEMRDIITVVSRARARPTGSRTCPTRGSTSRGVTRPARRSRRSTRSKATPTTRTSPRQPLPARPRSSRPTPASRPKSSTTSRGNAAPVACRRMRTMRRRSASTTSTTWTKRWSSPGRRTDSPGSCSARRK